MTQKRCKVCGLVSTVGADGVCGYCHHDNSANPRPGATRPTLSLIQRTLGTLRLIERTLGTLAMVMFAIASLVKIALLSLEVLRGQAPTTQTVVSGAIAAVSLVCIYILSRLRLGR